MIAKVGCRRLAISNFDVIKSIVQVIMYIEMDQGLKKLGPHTIHPHFLNLRNEV